MREGRSQDPAAPGGLAVAGVAAVAVVCCAGLPLMLVAAGGIASGVLLGAGAAIVAVAALGGLAIARLRRRRP